MNQMKSDKWAVVLNEKENSLVAGELDRFQELLLDYSAFSFVATIKHDQDTNQEGELKREHLHAYIEAPTEQTKRGFLDVLAELLKCEKEQISVAPTNSDILQVQYLTHKNAPEKAQYPYSAIKTTNAELLLQKYEATYTPPADREKAMLKALREAPSLYQFAEDYGLQDANRYRGLYKDFQKERQQADLSYAYALSQAKLDRMTKIADDLDNLLKKVEKGINLLPEQYRYKLGLATILKFHEDIMNHYPEVDDFNLNEVED